MRVARGLPLCRDDILSIARLQAAIPALEQFEGSHGKGLGGLYDHGTELSCRRFGDNTARLQVFALAYNRANILRRSVLPKPDRSWTLTTLREKLVKIGAKVVTRDGGWGACGTADVVTAAPGCRHPIRITTPAVGRRRVARHAPTVS